MTPYQHGFTQGYESINGIEQIGSAWADAFAQAEEHGEPLLTAAQESDWWRGFYHGRYDAKTDMLPDGLIKRTEHN